MSQPDPFLLIAGPQGDRRINLSQGAAWTIGRAEEHQVVLADESVSRSHALLQQTKPGELYLIDLGSRNGSFVNGVRVSVPLLLKDGDTIGIG